MKSRRVVAAFAALLWIVPVGSSQELRIVVENGKQAIAATPLRVPIQWDAKEKSPAGLRLVAGSTTAWGQLTEPSFRTESVKADPGKVRKDLLFIATDIKPNERREYVATVAMPRDVAQFVWKEHGKGETDLVLVDTSSSSGRPVMRYMHHAYDTSSKDARNKSYKPFHHLFDPKGKRLVTNGGHTDPYENEKSLTFPHHRGLMFAFNRISYGDKKTADTWHATGDAHQSHQKTIFANAGPVAGEHRALITWHGVKNEVFAEEERQMTVYNLPGGTPVEFATRLSSKAGKVRLDGDPQHAGFQFRASNEVAAKTAKQTFYVRPDGKGEPGQTRNWEPKTKKGPVNLPWNAICFRLGDQSFSVAYLDHPNNPGEKRYSERDYGRFGCYFEYDLTPEHPLVLNHRVWLQEGEIAGEAVERMSGAFVHPPHTSAR